MTVSPLESAAAGAARETTGLGDLDAPAGDQLRAYRLIPAKPQHRPPMVRQLLTHTAGLPQLLYPTRAFQPVLGETVPYVPEQGRTSCIPGSNFPAGLPYSPVAHESAR